MDITTVPHFVEQMAVRGLTFSDLANVALGELKAFGGRAEVVCGPISTGGYGKALANLLVFNHAIQVLQHAGRPIWSQMPYEAGLADLESAWKKDNPKALYCHPILTEFYQPLFEHNPPLIRRAWFITGPHGWETSTGAKWEHERFRKLGTDIRYFDESWHGKCSLPSNLD